VFRQLEERPGRYVPLLISLRLVKHSVDVRYDGFWAAAVS
jgi:hypothetical protein